MVNEITVQDFLYPHLPLGVKLCACPTRYWWAVVNGARLCLLCGRTWRKE